MPETSAPTFSIIIPTHNRAGLLRLTIESVLAQTSKDFELIVVDDGSTDDTPALLQGYGDKLRFVLRTNHGAESTRHHGASIARGEYLVLLDSDDLLFPWAIETYGKVVRELNAPPMIIAGMLEFEDGKPMRINQPTSRTVEVWQYRDLYSRDRPLASSSSQLVMKRSVVNELKVMRSEPTGFPFDTADMMLALGTTGPWVMVKDPITVAYRLHETNTIKNLKRMVDAAPLMMRLEQRNLYPGGSALRMDRYAYIGGVELGWVRRAKFAGKYGLALKLLAQSSVFVAAAVLRKIKRKFKQPVEPTVLPG